MNQSAHLGHLYRRAGFGRNFSEWQQGQLSSIEAATDKLFEEARSAKPLSEEGLRPLSKIKNLNNVEKKAQKIRARELLAATNTDWLMRMANPKESALLERMCLFWHGHFACENKSSFVAVRQLNTLRTHALGSFKDLLVAIARDPSMIRYLNNQQNKKLAPNENFARELLELFTLGIGQYSEQDIKEAARAFTGWSSNKEGEFIFRERQHDFGNKTFMGKLGDFDGEDIIDIILAQPQCAVFIVTKIYRYFVNEELDKERIQKLAQQFYQSNYAIDKLMYSIFTSDWFYEEQHIGTKIKSPIELLTSVFLSLNIKTIDPKSAIRAQRLLGQILFKPPNVAGWKGGKAWIDNATIMLRLNLVEALAKDANVNTRTTKNDEMMSAKRASKKIEINLSPFIEHLQEATDIEIYEQLSNYFLARPDHFDSTKVLPFTYTDSKENYIKSVILRLMSVPEFQLC